MRASHVLHLGVKELRSLARDPIMLVLIVYTFTVAIHTAATAMPETLTRAAIAIVDQDRSPLSLRITGAFRPPYFTPPVAISWAEMDTRMDAGLDTFALGIPSGLQRDLLAGRTPTIQLNVDATRMSQAFSGSGYVQAIVAAEVAAFTNDASTRQPPPVELALRARFNPELNHAWFGAIMELINQVTMLAIVLTGAALIREREHGTIEHLLVMPVTPFEIMASKVWSMGLVVLVACALSLLSVVEGLLAVPVAGSKLLFLAGAALHLFTATSMGIVLGTIGRSMPKFALLVLLVLIPLEMLSGGMTPRESMPDWVGFAMLAAPTTHFVAMAQAILYRGADLSIVWPQFAALFAIGAVFFGYALARFRSTVGALA